MSGDVVERCACDRCAKPVTYDLIVPDDVWARISPRPVDGWKSGGVLCPECILSDLITSQAAEIERIEKERVHLWNEVRDLKGALDVEKAATDAMRIERDEARENEDDGLAWDALKGCQAKLKTAERLLAEARAALEEIAGETEVHTKLNQVRLCCKFQHIAATTLTTLTNGGENGR